MIAFGDTTPTDEGADEKKEFVPREYQNELLEVAIRQNTIVFLPTGSGKTYIATMLIKALGKSIEPRFSQGGRRTFFLVNSVALVGQQAMSIRRHTPFQVGEYSGDHGVDFWDLNKWNEELEMNQVLVMTVQILLDMLQHGFVSFDVINLLIMDECHHATNNHPMKMVMTLYSEVYGHQLVTTRRPRIFGLTATLLNSNCRPERVSDEKNALEKTLDSKIAIPIMNRGLLTQFSTNPTEMFVRYSESNSTSAITEQVYERLNNELTKWIEYINCVFLLSDLELSEKLPNGAERFSSKISSRKKIINLLKNILTICDMLGIYAVNKAILSHIITLERVVLSHEDSNLVLLLRGLITALHRLRGFIDKTMEGNCPTGNRIYYFSTPKLRKLLDVLKEQKPENLTIVFVEFRLTAKVLYFVLSDISQQVDGFSHVKPDFIVGYENDPYKASRETLLDKKRNMTTLYEFNRGESNVLVASDVIEEGIDVQLCNLVIKFDLPKNVRSYIQSKGRARHKLSNYMLFVSDSNAKFEMSYKQFTKVEDKLKDAISFKDVDRETDGRDLDELALYKPYDPYPPAGPKLMPVSAISLLNRYCGSLPQDSYSQLTVEWYSKKENGKVKVYLKLPLDSGIHDIIESPECNKLITAKHLAAFQACTLLHKAGELDIHLMPRGRDSSHLDDGELFPHWRQADHTKAGTTKSKRRYDKEVPSFLYNCMPTESTPVYVHLLLVKPNFLEPIDCPRDLAFYRALRSDQNFAMLSSKPLPPICDFPLFMRVGEVAVNVKVNHLQMRLFNNLLFLLYDFHTFIFDKLLPINTGKQFLVRDNENKEYSYLITPCIYEESSQKFEIDWQLIHQQESLLKPVVEPTERTSRVTENSHFMKLVEPWYRGNISENYRYIVTEVHFDESPMTEFPSHNYPNYFTYYQDRYKQTIRDSDQPLIEVRPISSKIHYLKPREVVGVSKKRMIDDELFHEKFIPELCVVHEIPASYALKSTLLPSLLHRVYQLLVAEELRRSIALGTQLQRLDLPKDKTWEPLSIEKASLSEKFDDSGSLQSTIDVTNLLQSRMEALTVNEYPWKSQDEPCDIEKLIDQVDMLSIVHFESFITKPVSSPFSKNKAETKKRKNLIEPPPLKIFQSVTNHLLPELRDILTALTSKSSADIVNYERFETLGDSFLKFAVSLALFTAFPNEDEGKLTAVKGKIIGNRNLFYCGDSKSKLGMKIKINEFNVNDWDMPRFTIPRPLKALVSDLRVSPSLLYELRTTDEERRTGILKDSTICEFHKKLNEAIEQAGESNSTYDLIGHQTVSDKVVADCLEALIGVYVLMKAAHGRIKGKYVGEWIKVAIAVEAQGIEGGLKMCDWFGILPSHLANSTYLLRNPVQSPLFDQNKNPSDYINEPEELEYQLGYKFFDRGLLLQALTHPSFTGGITRCYQRLEFLGDAVLDFLVTNHIYEACGNLTPGELTDLRSALVNNVTFACLAVRYNFHTFINSRTCKLNELIGKFVDHQKMRNHAVGPEVLFLLEENETSVGSLVDVPKCLGDVFEALAGAIFLDCGKDLAVVWKVFYNLMHREITQFSQSVPKNMLRLLYEKFPNPLPKFRNSKIISDKRVMVGLDVDHNNKVYPFFGVGNNKREAKLAAAKMALRKFHSGEIVD